MAETWTDLFDSIRRRLEEVAEAVEQALSPRPEPVPVPASDGKGRRRPRPRRR